MSRTLSKRQKIYRQYLKSDHWKALRSKAIERDAGKCLRCKSEARIQVHHKCYRGRYEDSLIEDLETVCRECHRKEHGFGPSEFERQARKLMREMNYVELGCPKISPEEWKKLHNLIENYEDLWDFADVMFQYVINYQCHFSEGFETDWWMDKSRNKKWFDRAFVVRKNIWNRSLDCENKINAENPS